MAIDYRQLIYSMNRIVGWILSSSIFASFCALALTLGAERLLLGHGYTAYPGFDYNVERLNHPLHLLVFGSTLLEYNAHFLLNTREKGNSILVPWLLVLTGSVLCSMALFGMPLIVLAVVAVLGLFAVAYSAPYIPFRPKRRINDGGITKILVLTITWVAMTTIVPALYLGFKWNALGMELIVRTLLIFPLCLAFDLRDYESDKAKGIQTIAGAIGERNSYRLIYVILSALMLFGLLLRLQQLLTVTHLAIIILSALAACCAIYFARKTKHPFIYPGLIDGVMLLYGGLMCLLL